MNNSDNMPLVVSIVLFITFLTITPVRCLYLYLHLLEKQVFMSQTNWSYWVRDINLLTDQPM